MSILENIATRIIKEQELIVGPLAWSEAGKVPGIQVTYGNKSVALINNQKEVIDRLVDQYERLFGKASHEVCKDAVASIIVDLPPAEVPESLKA